MGEKKFKKIIRAIPGAVRTMQEILNALPKGQREKCSVCNETLTHVVKQLEAQAQVSNRQACRFMSQETGLTESQVRQRAFRTSGGPKRTNDEKSPDVVEVAKEIVGKGTVESGSLRKAGKELSEKTGIPEETARKKIAKVYAQVQTFNRTSDSAIEWAKYTWNPVTGCKHGCKYCYARKIADRQIGAYKDIGFKPHLHKERLKATENLPKNVKDKDKFCFVVSMGDLFGEWVPQKWIDKVMESIRKAPDWTFLLLTKNPKRYTELGSDYFPENVWLGASGGTQKLVDNAYFSFEKMVPENITFLSCEPLQEKIDIGENIFDWVIIGAQSNPEIQPKKNWVHSILAQAYLNRIPVYMKPNLDFRLKQKP